MTYKLSILARAWFELYRVGGLTHWRIGRLGGCVYWSCASIDDRCREIVADDFMASEEARLADRRAKALADWTVIQ